MTRDRDIAAIVLFLVCVGAFAYAGWSGPASAPYSGADVPVYRESYRECARKWQERPLGPAPHPATMAAEWADTYARDRRAAARTGCLDAITGRPPKI